MKNLCYVCKFRWKAFLFLGLIGCVVPSIQPLYSHSDVVFEESLLGDWLGRKSLWTFERKNGNSYNLTYQEGSDPVNDPSSCTFAEFEVHLVKLEDEYFLDFLPINYLNTENLFLLSHLIEAHSFAKIDIKKNNLELTLIDYQWLDDLLKQSPEVLDHIRYEESVILTADTKALQEFVKAYSSDNEAFTRPMELTRMKTQ